jgi:hypothetical protein
MASEFKADLSPYVVPLLRICGAVPPVTQVDRHMSNLLLTCLIFSFLLAVALP